MPMLWRLQHLDLHVRLGDWQLSAILERAPALAKLHVHSYLLSDASVGCLSEHCPLLEVVQIKSSRLLTDESVVRGVAGLAHLHTLKIGGTRGLFTERAATALGQGCAKLGHFELTGARRIGIGAVRAMSRWPALRAAALLGCNFPGPALDEIPPLFGEAAAAGALFPAIERLDFRFPCKYHRRFCEAAFGDDSRFTVEIDASAELAMVRELVSAASSRTKKVKVTTGPEWQRAQAPVVDAFTRKQEQRDNADQAIMAEFISTNKLAAFADEQGVSLWNDWYEAFDVDWTEAGGYSHRLNTMLDARLIQQEA